jgi:hypothetical protein
VTWFSPVGTGSIRAAICSRMASHNGGGEEVGGATGGLFNSPHVHKGDSLPPERNLEVGFNECRQEVWPAVPGTVARKADDLVLGNVDLGLRRCRHRYRSSATRRSWSARLGTTKDARKIGRMLFPVHRKATVWLSAASKV